MALTVLANICCTLITYICSWHKPTDVEVGHPPFPLTKSMEDIISKAGAVASEYRDAPLDFVSRSEWSGSLMLDYYVNILRSTKLLSMFNLHYDRPSQRVNTFNFPRPSSWRAEVLLLIVAVAYTSWFLAAWRFQFPSSVECTLWRVVSLTQTALPIMVGIFEIPYDCNKVDPRASSVPESTASPLSDSSPVPTPVANCSATVEKGRSDTPGSILHRLYRLWHRPYNNEWQLS